MSATKHNGQFYSTDSGQKMFQPGITLEMWLVLGVQRTRTMVSISSFVATLWEFSAYAKKSSWINWTHLVSDVPAFLFRSETHLLWMPCKCRPAYGRIRHLTDSVLSVFFFFPYDASGTDCLFTHCVKMWVKSSDWQLKPSRRAGAASRSDYKIKRRRKEKKKYGEWQQVCDLKPFTATVSGRSSALTAAKTAQGLSFRVLHHPAGEPSQSSKKEHRHLTW